MFQPSLEAILTAVEDQRSDYRSAHTHVIQRRREVAGLYEGNVAFSALFDDPQALPRALRARRTTKESVGIGTPAKGSRIKVKQPSQREGRVVKSWRWGAQVVVRMKKLQKRRGGRPGCQSKVRSRIATEGRMQKPAGRRHGLRKVKERRLLPPKA